ncbi:21754_t:CDS:2, partial [Gigaspora margarita]
HNSEMAKQLKVKNELGNIKKKINKIVLNYAALAQKLDKSRNKDQSSTCEKGSYCCYNCGEMGHYSRNCLSEKNSVITSWEIQGKEIYNLENELENSKILKCPINPNWDQCLKDRKLAKTQPILEKEGRLGMENVNAPINIENPIIKTRKKVETLAYIKKKMGSKWSLAEENPALYLTNSKKVPIKDNDSEVQKTIEDHIVVLVDNNESSSNKPKSFY